MARKRYLQDRWQLSFRLHNIEQALRQLFGTTNACDCAFRFINPLCDVVARRVIESVIPALQRATSAAEIISNNTLQFNGHSHGAFFAIELKLKAGDTALVSACSLLHALVDQ